MTIAAGTIAVAAGLLLVAASGVPAEVPVIGTPCEGCENAFVGMSDEISSTSRIAPADGIWHVRRDITLGLNVSDYPDASGR